MLVFLAPERFCHEQSYTQPGGVGPGPCLEWWGAGAEPTASAVIADLVDITRALTSDPENRVPHLAFQPSTLTDTAILPIAEVETAFYLRMCALDRPGVLADVTRILGERQISIEAFIQKEPQSGENKVNIIMLTQRVREGNMDEAIAAIEALDSICSSVTRIRVENLG